MDGGSIDWALKGRCEPLPTTSMSNGPVPNCQIENSWIDDSRGGRVNCNLGYERQGPEYVNCSNSATPVTTKCVKCKVSV